MPQSEENLRIEAFFNSDIRTLAIFASIFANKPEFPATIHQTYTTAVKGHYGGIVSRSI